MTDRITEKALVVPSLLIMEKHDGYISTTELIQEMPKVITFTGEDLKILKGRRDQKFTQKIRNLKSHRTLESLGFAKHKDGKFKITKLGIDALNNNRDSLLYLIGNNFNSNDSLEALENLTNTIKKDQRKMEVFDENILVVEGASEYTSSKQIKRSFQLRESAIAYYMEERGNISCDICSFDFEYTYGDPAKGYIEMHHIKPIYMYTDDNIQQVISDAIKNLLPVCANCHRVIHKTRPPYEIEDIKKFYQSRLNNNT
ncbi:hypothetical protein BSPWISOX_184 [uncultured Gammaproteobacteria bacterium]|jgi:predicted HNH restriction endonuclease|nr:hypothetical protein BSPWISOX_184 [uncultured Gammaproteobacteria bacterium]